jgi:hypothetical protein
MTRNAATAPKGQLVLEVTGEVARGLAAGGGNAILDDTDFDAARHRIGSTPKRSTRANRAGPPGHRTNDDAGVDRQRPRAGRA